jgi:hypothetical protein
MRKQSTNLIYYFGGCYGTFFEWICTHTNDISDINTPFAADGSSHNFLGNPLWLPGQLINNINSNENLKFARCHPAIFEKVNSNEITSKSNWIDIVYQDLSFLEDHYNKILILHPSLSTRLWIENNALQKCTITIDFFNKWYETAGYSQTFLSELLTPDLVEKLRIVISKEIDQQNLLKWGKCNPEEFDVWELREILSSYWFNREKDIFTCWDTLTKQFPNVKFLSMNSLRNNAYNEIVECLTYFNIDKYSNDKLNDTINSWQKMQIHLNKDKDVSNIVNCIVNDVDHNWDHVPLTLLDEAYIQKSLREFGIGIKCFNLNKFPTNSKEFLPYLEK